MDISSLANELFSSIGVIEFSGIWDIFASLTVLFLNSSKMRLTNLYCPRILVIKFRI